jgi:hypothetical protein
MLKNSKKVSRAHLHILCAYQVVSRRSDLFYGLCKRQNSVLIYRFALDFFFSIYTEQKHSGFHETLRGARKMWIYTHIILEFLFIC